MRGERKKLGGVCEREKVAALIPCVDLLIIPSADESSRSTTQQSRSWSWQRWILSTNISTAKSYPPGVPSTFCIAPASIAAQGEEWVPRAKWREAGVGSGADRKVIPSLSWDRENSASVAQRHYLGHL